MTKVILALFEGTPEQKLFGENAVKLLEIIVNSSSFQEKVLSAKYSGCLFWDDNGREIVVENQFILNQILTGKERKTQPDNIISIQVRLDKLKRGVLGSVTLPKPLITTNISYFKDWHKNNQALSLAAHWMHEWLHVSGFIHANRRIDENDVNYATGKLVVEIGREIAGLFYIDSSQKQGRGYLDAIAKVLEMAAKNDTTV